LNTKWYTLLIYGHLHSKTILQLLALLIDMKPDATHFIERVLIPDLDNECCELWNRLPNNLTNSTASRCFWNKLKLL